jgi:hypothetical protein
MDRSDNAGSVSGGENEYPASALYPTKWGEFFQRSDGKWETVWLLLLAHSVESREIAVHSDDSAGLVVTLHGSGKSEAELRVVTREHAMAAENYPATYKAFRLVDETIARIEEIQGLPRDWYAPFRGGGACE